MSEQSKQELQRVSIGIRDIPPCKGCTERFLACSDHCPKDERGEHGYKAWKACQKEVDNKRKAYNALNRQNRTLLWSDD